MIRYVAEKSSFSFLQEFISIGETLFCKDSFAKSLKEKPQIS